VKSDKKNAIYPGSFDPITKGHMDIIKRSAKMFDKLYVAVLTNSAKSSSFTIEERMDMIKKCTANISNVEVCTFTGLLAEYVKKINVITIIRGLRAVTDFEYEFQMALTNKKINKELETIFLTTNSKYMYLSSSIVKEIARNGGDVTDFVPPVVLADIKSRLDTRN
jgi:pantetheine-phosphate adenylyltransferase